MTLSRDQLWSPFQLHYHPSYEVYLCLIAQMTYLINGHLYTLRRGDLVFFTDRDLHQPFPPRDLCYERLIILFQPRLVWPLCSERTNLLACFQEAHIGCRMIHLDQAQCAEIISLTEVYATLHAAPDAYGTDVQLRLLLTHLLLRLNSWYSQQGPIRSVARPEREAEMIMAYIHQHLADPLPLQQLAEQFHRSPNRLNERFRRYAGKTIHQYIVSSRIALACRCLATGLPVTETALACGYANVSHFCRLFKSQIGLTASEYTRQFMSQDSGMR